MAAAFVSAWAGVAANGPNNVTTATKTTTTGNTLYVSIASNTNGTPVVTDSKSNGGWTQAQAPVNNGGDFISLYYCDSITGGTLHTVTVTITGASVIEAACGEWSGLATSGTLDKKTTGTGNSTTLDSGNTATTTQADEVLIGFGTVSDGANSSFTGTNGSTVRSQWGNATSWGVIYLEDELVSSVGTYNQTATWGGSAGAWIAGICTFKAAVTATAPSTPPPIVFGPGSRGPLAWQWTQRTGVDGAGAQFVINPAGSMTATGALTNQTGKPLVGSVTATGAFAKQAQKPLAGSSTASGALTRQTRKQLAGSTTASGVLTVVKVAILNLAGSMTASGVLTKQDRKNVAGSSTATGALAKQTGKALAGTVTASGVLTKQARKFFAGSSTASGALSVIKVAILNLAGSMTASGTLKRQTGKGLAGTVTPSGTVRKQTSTNLAGTMTATGTVAKQARRFFAGALTAVGNLVASLGGAQQPAVIRAVRIWRVDNRRTTVIDNRRTWRIDNRRRTVIDNRRIWRINDRRTWKEP